MRKQKRRKQLDSSREREVIRLNTALMGLLTALIKLVTED